jgi:hypothetical protein
VKRIFTRSVLFAALAALVSFAPRTVEATPLLPNTTGTVPNLAGVFNPGTLLDSIVLPFVTNTASITGIARSAVYRNANGLLDFYYQVTNDPAPLTSSNSISGVTASRFGGVFTDVGYRTDAFGVFLASTSQPITAARSANGSDITFWFGPPWGAPKIQPGETSSVLMIRTNATHYARTGTTAIQNGGMAFVNTFEPAAVPEPASVSMLLLGLAGLAGFRRRQV